MSKTILLADDNVTIHKVVELIFMDGDYRVEAVADGDQALARLTGGSWDLVVADVHMPGASGYEVARAAKRAHPGMPVLLLVGTFEAFDEDEAQRAGADAHLKKPFDSQELMRLVEELVSRAPEPALESEPAESTAGVSVVDDDDELTPQVSVGEGDAPDEVVATDRGDEIDTPAVDEDADVGVPTAAEISLDRELEGAQQEDAGSDDLPRAAEVDGPDAVAGEAVTETATTPPAAGLSDRDVDRIARRIVEILGDQAVREVAWEVIPDMAELVVKDRLRELEREVDQASEES